MDILKNIKKGVSLCIVFVLKNNKCKTNLTSRADEKGNRNMEEVKHCSNCKYARTRQGDNGMWYCGKHKTYITELTQPLWIAACKGKHYEDRGKE